MCGLFFATPCVSHQCLLLLLPARAEGKGKCANGDNCRFAHSRSQLLRRGAEAAAAAERWLAFEDVTPQAAAGASAPPAAARHSASSGTASRTAAFAGPSAPAAAGKGDASAFGSGSRETAERSGLVGCDLCGVRRTMSAAQLVIHVRGRKHREAEEHAAKAAAKAAAAAAPAAVPAAAAVRWGALAQQQQQQRPPGSGVPWWEVLVNAAEAEPFVPRAERPVGVGPTRLISSALSGLLSAGGGGGGAAAVSSSAAAPPPAALSAPPLAFGADDLLRPRGAPCWADDDAARAADKETGTARGTPTRGAPAAGGGGGRAGGEMESDHERRRNLRRALVAARRVKPSVFRAILCLDFPKARRLLHRPLPMLSDACLAILRGVLSSRADGALSLRQLILLALASFVVRRGSGASVATYAPSPTAKSGSCRPALRRRQRTRASSPRLSTTPRPPQGGGGVLPTAPRLHLALWWWWRTQSWRTESSSSKLMRRRRAAGLEGHSSSSSSRCWRRPYFAPQRHRRRRCQLKQSTALQHLSSSKSSRSRRRMERRGGRRRQRHCPSLP